MRELNSAEIERTAGGNEPDLVLPTVRKTAPPPRERTVIDELATLGIVDFGVLLYGPNGQPPLNAPDIDLGFPLTPNIPNEDALRDAISNAAVLEALGKIGERMGEDHRQIINILADIKGMNQENYDALLAALTQLQHDFENDADASTNASDVGILLGVLGLMRSH